MRLNWLMSTTAMTRAPADDAAGSSNAGGGSGDPTPTPAPAPEPTPAPQADLIGGGDKPAEGDQSKPAEGDDKSAEASKPEEPVTFESLKIPEGMEADPELGKTFTDLINDQNLSRAELAQKLIELQASTYQKASERASELWEETKEQWRSAFRSDPEVGGAKFNATLQTANAIVDRFSVNPDGTQNGLKELLQMTGIGNHVEFGRFMARIAPYLREPTDLPGGQPNGGKVVPTRDNLYPEQG